MTQTLFAVYLGGRAPKCHTELHDVVFAVGESIADTYEQLMTQWFGTPVGLHLDSWMALERVDGHRIRIAPGPHPGGAEKLFFVNLGAYAQGLFGELHASIFLVAENAAAAKARAKERLRAKLPGPLHTDDLYAVDDCVEVRAPGEFHIALAKTDESELLMPENGYHLIPEPLVQDFMRRHSLR
jgi:hypothetical protein